MCKKSIDLLLNKIMQTVRKLSEEVAEYEKNLEKLENTNKRG